MSWSWPWQKPEERQSGGGYSDAITAAIEAQASATVADVSSTAAIESACGALSRAFAGCDVIGPGWVQDAVNPVWRAQVGRSILREGASLSVVDMDGAGSVHLTPAAFWNFENLNPGAQREGERESSWMCRVTTYGPSTSYTRLLPRDRLTFVRWGTSPGTRHRGQGPASWAHLTARLQGETERSLADEAAGPLAQMLSIPKDPQAGPADTTLDPLLKTVTAARGKALLLKTTQDGWGEGRQAAPPQNRDWKQARLGPMPPDPLVQLSDMAFRRMLSACGTPPAVFMAESGTAQRDAIRFWMLNLVKPIANIIEAELTMGLGTEVKFRFDNYPLDLAGRAQSFQKLVAGGLDPLKALAIAGLLADDA